jgi:hypothetical protein
MGFFARIVSVSAMPNIPTTVRLHLHDRGLFCLLRPSNAIFDIVSHLPRWPYPRQLGHRDPQVQTFMRSVSDHGPGQVE